VISPERKLCHSCKAAKSGHKGLAGWHNPDWLAATRPGWSWPVGISSLDLRSRRSLAAFPEKATA